MEGEKEMKDLCFLTKLNFIHKGEREPGGNILFRFVML